jgi:putative ATPase
VSDLFSTQVNLDLLPLAERVRPKKLSEIFGQTHFLSEKSAVFKLLKANHLLNLIFWGPPGTGKTTLAMALAQSTNAHWIQLNAVDSGVKDLKLACETGRNLKLEQQRKTLLFVDEIHRFNKSQQDVLLPYVERGDVYLIGATTEYPSYELNKALLSRCQVVEFKKLSNDELMQVVNRAFMQMNLEKENIFQTEALEQLFSYADGDSRKILNVLDLVFKLFSLDEEKNIFPLSLLGLEEFLGKKLISYDKKSDQHYDCISAFIKSMRGSDPDAAMYYCARMLEGGEDPTFIARRMIIFASEDVGNADPRALPLAVACLQAVESIGMPEARINLGQTVAFLASAPKSNRSYVAINKAIEYVQKTGTADIPHLLKSSQKNKGYKYPHDFDRGYIAQNYWPESLKPEKFYEPKNIGAEKNLTEYLAWIKQENSSTKV